MPKLDNPLEVYKLLPKTNCRQCGDATCLAFAAAVIQGRKSLDKCPLLESNMIEELNPKLIRQQTPLEHMKQLLVPLRKELLALDFSAAAERIGGTLSGDKLIIKCLGKDFSVNSQGEISSDCHVNEWVTVPLLNYIVYSAGKDPSGQWVPFREISNEMVWDSYFEYRVEKPLKQIADVYPDLLEDMIYIFNGKPVENRFSFDISLVLQPLPKVPMLICYTKPEEELESKLNIFFDSAAGENLNVDSIYRLSMGLLVMFQKIAARHLKIW